MADPLSYNQLLEKSKEIDELLQSSIDSEEKEELEYIWNCLKSREESKFDAIISVIKDCDKQISTREKEIIELKKNQIYSSSSFSSLSIDDCSNSSISLPFSSN